ncbi:putative methyltransferase [Histoplasma capsulatum]|uniref:Putative methyltransferase n=1 Tax=Ajellomyces capsulatus TaxID=5037 RepID=A0A8A1MEQ0_AJECA|nr:putative methyltransferase [Histoplasma capsulatum]
MSSANEFPPISIDSEEEDTIPLEKAYTSFRMTRLVEPISHIYYGHFAPDYRHRFSDGQHIRFQQKESNRLDIVHYMTVALCDEKLHLAPIGSSPQNILDIGAGTGIWCCQMGDDYPSAQILGVDLSAIRDTKHVTPENVRFEIDDIESDWTFIDSFDYIHCRYMYAAIRDWPKLVERCFNHLTPGCWAEFQDFDVPWYSDDGTYDAESSLGRWYKLFYKATRQHGRELSPGPKLEGWVRGAGFTDVVVKKLRVPVGRWPKDPKLKTVGTWNLLQVIEGMEGFSMALFSRVLGWSPDAIQAFVAEVVKDLRNPKMHAQFDLYIVYGRKPETSK